MITAKTISGNLMLGRAVAFCPRCQSIFLTWPGKITAPLDGDQCRCGAYLEIVEPPDGTAPAAAK